MQERKEIAPRRYRMAMLCVSYFENETCKVERLILPTGIPKPWAERHRACAEQYQTLSDVLQDFWIPISGESPEGDFMWFYKKA